MKSAGILWGVAAAGLLLVTNPCQVVAEEDPRPAAGAISRPGEGPRHYHRGDASCLFGEGCSDECCNAGCACISTGFLSTLAGQPPTGGAHSPGYRYPETAFARSLIFPGFGQFYAEAPGAGAFYLATETALLGSVILTYEWAYVPARDSGDTLRIQKAGDVVTGLTLGLIGMHLINMINAPLRAGVYNDIHGFTLVPGPRGATLAFTTRF